MISLFERWITGGQSSLNIFSFLTFNQRSFVLSRYVTYTNSRACSCSCVMILAALSRNVNEVWTRFSDPNPNRSWYWLTVSLQVDMEEADKLIGTGKRHLVMGKAVEAVNVLQEACGMLWVANVWLKENKIRTYFSPSGFTCNLPLSCTRS